MRSSRLLISSIAAVCSIWVLAGGCSSSDDGPGTTNGPDFDPSDAAGDGTVVMPDAGNVEAGGGGSLDPLCGQGTCNPDEATACQDYDPGVGGAPAATPEPPSAGGANEPVSSTGGAAGASNAASSSGGESGAGNHAGVAGVSGEGGAAGEVSGPDAETGQGGAPGAAGARSESEGGAAGARSESAGAGAGGVATAGPATFACQVTFASPNAERACVAAGTGKGKAPCISAADCAAGFACVTEGEVGRCVGYCCGGDAQCTSGEYCAPREVLRSSSAEPRREVPVCIPADDCSLNEPFPCPAGNDCRCPSGKACMVVRAGGTTTCLTPGSGTQGGACPCAWGHVCSSATNSCVKICSTSSGPADCGTQKCQASSELPQGFGVCVGSAR